VCSAWKKQLPLCCPVQGLRISAFAPSSPVFISRLNLWSLSCPPERRRLKMKTPDKDAAARLHLRSSPPVFISRLCLRSLSCPPERRRLKMKTPDKDAAARLHLRSLSPVFVCPPERRRLKRRVYSIPHRPFPNTLPCFQALPSLHAATSLPFQSRGVRLAMTSQDRRQA